MLHELYKMYKGLESVDALPPEKHNDIQFPGMGTTFRVELGKAGEVKNFDLMDKAQIKNCWTLGDGNKNQFPAIKLTFPLIPAAHQAYKAWKEDHKKPKQNDLVDLLTDQMGKHELDLSSISEWPSYRKRIIERQQKFKADFADKNFYKLFERFVLIPENGVQLLKEVCVVIQQTLKARAIEELAEIANLLFGSELNAKGLIKDGKRITLFIDTFPRDDIDRYVSSHKEIPALSNALFSLEKTLDAKHQITCALTNEKSFPVEKKFPSEKLSVIGSTILFTKSDTSGPTVQRYGKWNTDAYLVSKTLTQKLAASIAFLASEKQKDTTWRKTPASSGKSPNLLLAYCLDDASIPVGNLIAFGSSDVKNFEDYEEATKTVIRISDGRSDLKPESAVELAEIIALDKANRKINYAYSTDLAALFSAAKAWQAACKNVPDFQLFALIGKEAKPSSALSVAVAPIQCNYLSKIQYIRDGAEFVPVPGMSFAETMQLFFSETESVDAAATIKQWLTRLTEQYQPLFSLCSLAKSHYWVTGKQARHAASPKLNTQALIATTLLSILLYKSNRVKGDYMNDFAYQLGQTCSALDELHIAYCFAERGGDVPNTTLGNTIYAMALQDPKKVLKDILPSRIKPYKAWVIRSQYREIKDENKKKIIKAGYYANTWIAKTSPALRQHIKEHEFKITDTYKAELMLGYLAGRPFEGKKSTQAS